MSEEDSKFWEKVLKDKCLDCYELNRYRELRHAKAGAIHDGHILDIRYCPKHEKMLEELQMLSENKETEK